MSFADPNQIPTQWGPPYLLYLGNARDDLAAKTAPGLVRGAVPRQPLCHDPGIA